MGRMKLTSIVPVPVSGSTSAAARPARRPAAVVITSVVALLVGFFGVGLAAAGPAAAHSGVISSSPASGAELDRSPGEVSVTFNEELRAEYATLLVIGPDGHFWQQGDPVVSGRTVSVPVNALGPVGEYKVNFRVTSADGHPVQGQRTFTLTVAGDGQPGALADAEELAVTDEGSGFPVWAIVLIVVVVLLVIAGAVVLVLRRREE